METFLADRQISRVEKLRDGAVVLSLAQGVDPPRAGDVVVTSIGTWLVEGRFPGPSGTQLRVMSNPHH